MNGERYLHPHDLVRFLPGRPSHTEDAPRRRRSSAANTGGELIVPDTNLPWHRNPRAIGSIRNNPQNIRGGQALWLGRWICNPEVPGSVPPPCHKMNLCLVVPDSTIPHFVSSQLVRVPPDGILTSFWLLCNICFLISVSTITTAVLNT